MTVQNNPVDKKRSVLQTFRIHWNGIESVFRVVLEMDSFLSVDLTDSRYILQIDGSPIGSVFRTAQGKYLSINPLEFNATQRSHTLSLLDSNGIQVAEHLIDLFSSRQNIAFYSAEDGKVCSDEYGPSDTKAGWLVIFDDKLEVTPKPSFEVRPGTGIAFGALSKDWDKTTSVKLGSDIVWRLRERGQSDKTKKGDWRDAVRVELDSWSPVSGKRAQIKYPRLGDRIDVAIINLPKDLTLHSVTCDGIPLNFQQKSYFATVQGCPIDERVTTTGLPLTLTVGDCDSTNQVTALLRCDVKGASLLFPDGRRIPLSAKKSLPMRYARNARLEPVLPKLTAEERKSLAVFQGDELIAKLPNRARNWPQLKPTGAPLLLRRAFNADANNVLVLAGSVRDSGVVNKVVEQGAVCSIQLNSPIEMSDRHAVVFWDPESVPTITLYKKPVIVDNKIETRFVRTAAYGLAYRGVWLGGNSVPALTVIANRRTCSLAEFALLRWYRSPILSPEFESKFAGIVQQNVSSAFAAWLCGQGLPEGLRVDSEISTWTAVLRTFLFSWQPKEEALAQLINELNMWYPPSSPQGSQLPTLLQDIVPLLIRDIACLWGRSFSVPAGGQSVLSNWATVLADPHPLDRAKNWLRKDVMESMGVEEGFVDSLMKSAASMPSCKNSVHIQNVRTALSYQSFRKLLAITSLSRL